MPKINKKIFKVIKKQKIVLLIFILFSVLIAGFAIYKQANKRPVKPENVATTNESQPPKPSGQPADEESKDKTPPKKTSKNKQGSSNPVPKPGTNTPPKSTPPDGDTPVTPPKNTSNPAVAAQVSYDMYGSPARTDGLYAGWGRHEASPRGVPTSYDWYHGARPSEHILTKYGATSPWGQLMVDKNGTGTFNVRLQTRNPRMYFLKNNVWQNVSVNAKVMEGAYWKGNFSGTYQNFTQRSEASNGGGSSVALSPLNNWSDSILHWWWQEWYPRTPITSNVQAGFFVVEMRLIPDTDSSVNLASAKFIAGASADLYDSPTDSGGAINSGWGISRLKYVTSYWKKFSYTTRTSAQIYANTPPY